MKTLKKPSFNLTSCRSPSGVSFLHITTSKQTILILIEVHTVNGLAASYLSRFDKTAPVGMEQLNLPIDRTKSCFYEIKFELLFLADDFAFFLRKQNHANDGIIQFLTKRIPYVSCSFTSTWSGFRFLFLFASVTLTISRNRSLYFAASELTQKDAILFET